MSEIVVNNSTTRLVSDEHSELKRKFRAYCLNLGIYFSSILSQEKEYPLQKSKMDMFSRFLKSCNNDGHKLKVEYWDSDKKKLMFISILDKRGRKDGPSLHMSDDGKEISFGWFRKDRAHGKWIKRSKDGHFTYFQRVIDKNGKDISPATGVSDGKLTKFIHKFGKINSMMNVMVDSKPTKEYKDEIRNRIKAMQTEGKSGVVLVDKKLSETRQRLAELKRREESISPSPTFKENKATNKTEESASIKIFRKLHNNQNSN